MWGQVASSHPQKIVRHGRPSSCSDSAPGSTARVHAAGGNVDAGEGPASTPADGVSAAGGGVLAAGGEGAGLTEEIVVRFQVCSPRLGGAVVVADGKAVLRLPLLLSPKGGGVCSPAGRSRL